MKSTVREYNSPRKRHLWVLSPTLGNTCHTYYCRSVKCKQSPVYGVFDRYFHIPLPIVRNLPVKFGTNPSTIFLVIVVTDRQTHTQADTQTNAGKNILPHFRGENYWHQTVTWMFVDTEQPTRRIDLSIACQKCKYFYRVSDVRDRRGKLTDR